MDILDIFLNILLKPPQPLMGLFLKKTYFKNVSKMCSAKYDFNISDLLCSKPLIITGVT